MPSAFPALGHDVSTDCRTHSVDLSAQKLSLFAPDLADKSIQFRRDVAHSSHQCTVHAASGRATQCRCRYQHRQSRPSHIYRHVVRPEGDARVGHPVRARPGASLDDTTACVIPFLVRCPLMDLGLLVAIVMLIVWGIGTFALEAPGWIHLLLSVGVFVLIWRISVITSTHSAPTASEAEEPRGR
jgi:hypothetical protein